MSNAKPRIGQQEAEDFLRRHFGLFDNLHGIKEGEESQALSFQSRGPQFVLRINANRAGFEMDRMAAERFNGAGLPVPRVVLIEPLGSYHACVSEGAYGVTLQDLHSEASYACGRAVCSLLENMSQCDTSWISGYGRFGPHGTAPHESWPAVLGAIAAWNWHGLEEEAMPLVAQVIQRAGTLPNRHGLIHGDFGSNNVLVADRRVTGLIDWSEAMVGDPLYDVGNLFFWRPWLDCMEQQCRYLMAEAPQMVREEDHIVTYAVHIGLVAAHEAALSANLHLAKWALNRCRELLLRGCAA